MASPSGFRDSTREWSRTVERTSLYKSVSSCPVCELWLGDGHVCSDIQWRWESRMNGVGRGKGSGSKEQHVRRLRGKGCWEFSPARVSEQGLNLPQVRGYSIIWVPAQGSCHTSPARGIVLCGSAPPLHIGYSPSCLMFQPPHCGWWILKKYFYFNIRPNKRELGRWVCCPPPSPAPRPNPQ